MSTGIARLGSRQVRPWRTTRRVSACAAVLLWTAACGSLLDESSTPGTSLGGVDGSAAPSTDAGGPLPTGGTTGVTLPSPSSVHGGGGTTGTSGVIGTTGTTGVSPGGGGRFPSAGKSGRGFTAKTIKVGLSLPDASANAIYSKAGGTGINQADLVTTAKAMVAYVNAHGGIAGRQVVPVYNIHGGSESSSETSYEADCQAFTADNQVFAAYSADGSATTIHDFADCLAKHKTVLMLQTDTAWDRNDFSKLTSYVYSPSYLSGERWPVIIDQLKQMQYFDKGYKLGLVSIQEPAAQRLLNNVVVPTLKARGLKVADVASTSSFSDWQGLGQLAADTQKIVVRFAAEGITHVMFVGTYTSVSYFFPKSADGQNYRPRYAFNTTEAPQALSVNEPPAQMHRALAVGWNPGLDVDDAQDPGDNPQFKLCLSIAQKAGVEIPDRAGAYGIAALCDALFFLKASLDKAPELSPQGMAASARVLGTGYRSAETHATDFRSGRADGVSAVRGLVFEDACTCWKYTGKWIPAP